MKRKPREEMDYRELAAELARNSIVTKCLARYLEQVIEEVHDSQIKPLRDALKACAEARMPGEARRIALTALGTLADPSPDRT